MKEIKILDCTLRDGGRIIDCHFEDNDIKNITARLTNAKIDIIEVGFLRDRRNIKYSSNSTFFTDVDQIKPFLTKKSGSLYVAFIDYGMFDINSLKECDGTSIDGIRFGFTKKDYDESREDILFWIETIKSKGYKLFIQGVNSLSYTDKELLEVVDMINKVKPYSFGIVDTYGAMYMDDVDRIFGVIDHNMHSDIHINFHSHNNYQLSFALAQEIIRLSRNSGRKIIIDGTLYGMGKVAGNLNTELLTDFLVRKFRYDYDTDLIFDTIDDYIYKYTLKYKWGYSVPALMAGVYKSHPNNIIYLTEKFRLRAKDVGRLLAMIEPKKRQRYDYENIEHIYREYAGKNINDSNEIELLKNLFFNREILVLVPGSSLKKYKKQIQEYITIFSPLIISVNFVSNYMDSWIFYGNNKRYHSNKNEHNGKKIIISSNIDSVSEEDIVVNYYGLINRDFKFFDNSTIMLLNLLKKTVPKRILLAGFDGFSSMIEDNFVDKSFQNDRHNTDLFDFVNREISLMIKDYAQQVIDKTEIVFLTPSYYKPFLKDTKIKFINIKKFIGIKENI